SKLTTFTVLVLTVLLAPSVPAATIGAGDSLSCAVTAAGGVKCWGVGYAQPTYGLPVDVPGLTSGVTAVATGFLTKCALTTAGGVKCWGRNEYGQLGDGTTTERTTPVDVSGLTSGVKAITVGGMHSCALTTAGGVKCWGYNSLGELGDSSTTQRLTPVDVSGLTSGVANISAGSYHTCAVTTAGGLKCWGDNESGKLGDNTTTRRLTPVDVVGLTSGVSAVAASGAHTCALTTAGGVKCWGFAYYGSLGDGTYTDHKVPADVLGITSGMTSLATRSDYSYATVCAGSASGVKCWGYNDMSQVGDGTTTTRNAPVDVQGLGGGVTELAVGSQHVCARMTDGGVKCWGANGYGQLGDGTTTRRTAPVSVIGLTPPISSSDCLFNYVEKTYPSYFAPAGATSATAMDYYYRAYSTTTSSLGIASRDNHLYYIGPVSNNTLADLGIVSGWLSTAGCQ
ncbi:MAG: RCC1 repeat-containing protein, partial [Proteobacteria bacterium]|nr:RCC1 repeat-containing protein [Pseudomonadota bacterium]